MLDNVQKTHYIEFLVTLRDPLLRGKNERWTKLYEFLAVFSHSPGPPSAREKRTFDQNIFGFEKVPAL